ncbi:hypothetical protein GCM10010448_06220 [Streptomyces glomeratus]|uniref:Uncharacterized protein n=1 Tax=Streptomyces glomeratus TaxID=284452 RepID=A0ABP6KYG0_9ACTN
MTWADIGMAGGAVSVMGRPIVRWGGKRRAGGADGGCAPEDEATGSALAPFPGEREGDERGRGTRRPPASR